MSLEKSKETCQECCDHDYEHVIDVHEVWWYKCGKCGLAMECYACKQEQGPEYYMFVPKE